MGEWISFVYSPIIICKIVFFCLKCIVWRVDVDYIDFACVGVGEG